MPTANSAGQNQPTTTTSHRFYLRPLARAALGVFIGLAVILPAQTIAAPAAAASTKPGTCPGWNSTTQPPDYIRVLRRHTGNVDRVPFKKYVLTVLGKEWPGYLPQAVINAGAVAVKQYAWFHALGNGRVSRKGQCFDVTDGTGDQLYKPNKSRIRQDHYTALAATWGVRLVKKGSLFMTGYRSGNKGACGHDATGWKLFARSATRCANRGDSFLSILRIYYGPVSVVSKTGGAADGFSSLTVETSPTATSPDATSPDATSPDATSPDASAAGATLTAAGDVNGGVTVEESFPAAPPAQAPVDQIAFTAA